jgi:KaiC/GvpD/RAD55 family RecA-like ATPase
MFGRKKKDDKEGEALEDVSTAESASTANAPATSTPVQAPSVSASSPTPPNLPHVSATGSYQPPRTSPAPPQVDEDSSLSRLLQSLLKDLPPDASSFSGDQPRGFAMQSSPEWVPPRATPTSRPMMIVPGGKKDAEPDKPSMAPSPPVPPARSTKPPEPVQPPTKEVVQSKFSPQPSGDKPEKPAREEPPKRLSTPKASQSFDHIFDLTQGSLESPGLVVVNGSQGAGKTTLCSGLASSFLKQGNPCMFVTYDKAPAALREQMKKIGADPSEAESQYRFLLVDGFSSQSDSFSFEPYYVEKAFDFDSIQDALVKNSSMFIGEKTKILFDSIDQVVAKIASKDFVKRLSETLDKLRDSNVTLVLTADLSKAPKDVVKWLEDTASCVIDLDRDDSDPNGRELKVRKLNGSASKLDTETFEIDSSKGLVFVK